MHIESCPTAAVSLDSPCVHTCEDHAPLVGPVTRAFCHSEEHSSPTGYSSRLSLAFSVPTGHGKEHSAPTGHSSCLSLAYSIPTGDMGRNILHPLATHADLLCLQHPHGGTWAGLVGLDTALETLSVLWLSLLCFVTRCPGPAAVCNLGGPVWVQTGSPSHLLLFPGQPQLPEVSGGVTERLAEQPCVLTWFLSDPLVTSVPASTQFRSVIPERPPTQGSEEERMTTEENAKRQGPRTFALRDSD